MNVLTLAISLFLVLETSNVILLYFFPTSNKGNGMVAFNAFEKSKEIPEVHDLVKYLINWVAGTKLIFITLLILIIIYGDSTLQLYSVIALIVSISTFYWRLYPLIKSMDTEHQISPKGYSKTLAKMIGSFIFIFLSVALYYLFFQLK
jgi:hypothetical protein